jgi:hypothetical protein
MSHTPARITIPFDRSTTAAEEVPHVVAGIQARSVAVAARGSRRVAVLADRDAHQVPPAPGAARRRRVLWHRDVGQRSRRRAPPVEAIVGKRLRHRPERLHERHDAAHVVGGHAADIWTFQASRPRIVSSSTWSGNEPAGTVTLAEWTSPHGPAKGIPPANSRARSKCLPPGWRGVVVLLTGEDRGQVLAAHGIALRPRCRLDAGR